MPKKTTPRAKSWKLHCVDLRNTKPASAVDPAPAVADAVDQDSGTPMDTEMAPTSAVDSSTTNTITSTVSEGDAQASDNTPLVVATQGDNDSDEEAGSAMDDSDDNGEPAHPYIEVPYKEHRANCMIETAAFGDEPSSLKTKLHRLMECLAGTAVPLRTPSVRHLLTEDASSVPFFVFEIGDNAEREILLGQGINSPDGSKSWSFLPLTVEKQKAEKSRTIDLRSLQYDTKDYNIVAALRRYGKVERVEMGFNQTKSMATARVVFTSEKAVQDMIDRGITCVLVGQDTGIVARLGESRPKFVPALTLKLTHLPFGYTPYDVAEALSQFPIFGVTMPLDPNTRSRKMEAFVYFSTKEDQELAQEQEFHLGKADNLKIAAWAGATESTCYGCGAVGHRSNKCDVRSNFMAIRQQRQRNATLISPTKQQQKAPGQHTAKPPTTNAQIKGKGKEVPPAPASRWTNGKASAFFRTASHATSNNAGPSKPANYAQQNATASGKAPTATSSPQQPSPATSSLQQPQPAWKAAHDAMLQNVRQANVRLDKKIEEWQQQMQNQLQQVDRRLDRMEQMLQVFCGQPTQKKNLPSTSDSVRKIVNIAQSTTQEADARKAHNLQERLEIEQRQKHFLDMHHRVQEAEARAAAMQRELEGSKVLLAQQDEFLRRQAGFEQQQQQQQATEHSRVSNTPQSQQGVMPLSDSQFMQQTLPFSFPGAPLTFPSVPSPPDFSSQMSYHTGTIYSQDSGLEDSVHYSPAAPSGDMDTTDFSQSQSQGPQSTLDSLNES
ncbi:hypothetical protein BGZ72_001987 [Mortierella alpina]|nr:hypothetical protein BGZ72_001987 [Mortierella alpina]